MSSMVKVSEAASMAMHTMVLLADQPDRPISAREVAGTLKVSEAHLAKVLQRLSHAGLTLSTRGPGGGFVLSKPADETTLLEVFEAIEGPLQESNCLLTTTVCGGSQCILGNLLSNVNHEVRNYLSRTTLTDLTPVYQSLHKSTLAAPTTARLVR